MLHTFCPTGHQDIGQSQQRQSCKYNITKIAFVFLKVCPSYELEDTSTWVLFRPFQNQLSAWCWGGNSSLIFPIAYPHVLLLINLRTTNTCIPSGPSRQAGKPICRVLQGGGCLLGRELGPWALLGTGRVLRGVHQLHRPLVLWGHSALPHRRGICWPPSWQRGAMSHLACIHTQRREER